MKKIFSAIKKVLAAVFLILPIILIGYVLAEHFTGDVPTLFGYSASVVITPSMSDVLPVGSVILSKHYTPGDELNVGDIVTYHGQTGSFEGKLVTHKIESITEENGETVIVTKGTMNTAEDPAISPENVESVFVCRVVNLGKFYDILRNPLGFLFILVLPISAIIVFELWNFKRNLDEEKEENLRAEAIAEAQKMLADAEAAKAAEESEEASGK